MIDLTEAQGIANFDKLSVRDNLSNQDEQISSFAAAVETVESRDRQHAFAR